MSKFLSLEEATQRLEISSEEVAWLLRRGDLEGRQVGQEWQVNEASVDLYRAERRAERTAWRGISDEEESAEEKIADTDEEKRSRLG